MFLCTPHYYIKRTAVVTVGVVAAIYPQHFPFMDKLRQVNNKNKKKEIAKVLCMALYVSTCIFSREGKGIHLTATMPQNNIPNFFTYQNYDHFL